MNTNTFFNGLNLKTNSKGGKYHGTTFDANLDLFALNGRHYDDKELEPLFIRAVEEDKKLFVKNVLNLLDIRGGKGERKLFKSALHFTMRRNTDVSKLILNAIPELGRWDYILEAFKQDYDMELKAHAAQMIIKELSGPESAKNPSLLVKWLPSINASSADTRRMAKFIIQLLGTNNTDYRKYLSEMRAKLKLVENAMRTKNYDFDYSKIPSKAMLKYKKAFLRNDNDKYSQFLDSLSKGEVTVKATNITPGEIAARVSRDEETKLLDGMWANMKDIKIPDGARVLPMVDTSGSMGSLDWGTTLDEPIAQSIGLGLYFAERGVGAFKNKFLTFSTKPTLQTVTGKTVSTKMKSMNKAEWQMSTNIDAAFELVLNATLNSSDVDTPTHILIISDMEFDRAQNGKTNFNHWKDEYAKHDLQMPKIIFWNVSRHTDGYPVVKDTENVAMVSGYSVNVAENLFDLEQFTPTSVMLKTLDKYEKYL